jgi:hypothetical protein
VLVFGAAVAGSGIRTIQEGAGTPAGDVNLIAPVGAVNAGDAGIGAAGNINLAAAVVTGASNINFNGTATGVPPAVANVTASVSGAASAASATANTASSIENVANKEEEASATSAAVSWLDVFVSGLGEENCKPEDQDCLERQKKAKSSRAHELHPEKPCNGRASHRSVAWRAASGSRADLRAPGGGRRSRRRDVACGDAHGWRKTPRGERSSTAACAIAAG